MKRHLWKLLFWGICGVAFGQHQQAELWVCTAFPQGHRGPLDLAFEGYSQLFDQRTGPGYHEKNEALQNAQLSCERSTRMRCQVRLEACSLRRLHRIPGGGGGDRFGDWIQTEGGDCRQVCGQQGLTSARSREGAVCASGENRPLSAIHAGISFQYGPRHDRGGSHSLNTFSEGRFCYQPGQKRDNDATDLTVGCFCR